MALVARWDRINAIVAEMYREQRRQRAAYRRALLPSLEAEGLSKRAIQRIVKRSFDAIREEGIWIAGDGIRHEPEHPSDA